MNNLPEITDEDRAVAMEAVQIWDRLPAKSISAITIAAALARTARKKEDPDLLLARKVCSELELQNKDKYLSGEADAWYDVRAALVAIKVARAGTKA
jgi:hypothetical protein